VLGLAMLAGLPRLGMERGPPPGVAGEVRECSEAPRDSWEAGEPPLWLLSSASLPLLEQLLWMLGPRGGAFRGGMASPSSSKVVASISCSERPFARRNARCSGHGAPRTPAERRRIREENAAKHDANMKAFNDMIEAARRQKREKDAMRAEDKFTDETDPVESAERRMRRQIDQWKEEHADEIRDDAREHAERCLEQERRGQAPPPEAAADAAAVTALVTA